MPKRIQDLIVCSFSMVCHDTALVGRISQRNICDQLHIADPLPGQYSPEKQSVVRHAAIPSVTTIPMPVNLIFTHSTFPGFSIFVANPLQLIVLNLTLAYL